MSEKCGKINIHLRSKQTNPDGSFSDIIMKAHCKSWSCPVCRKRKARWIEEQIHQHFADGDVYLLTLTYFQNRSKKDVWNSLGPSWNRLSTYIRKKFGKFKYIRIVEPHKSNYPHLHIILNRYIDTKIAFKYLTSQGFGWNMSLKKITVKSARLYVAKYLSKVEWSQEAESFRVSSKCRIVSCSKGIIITPQSNNMFNCIHPNINDSSIVDYAKCIISDAYEEGCIALTVYCEKGYIRINYTTDYNVELSIHFINAIPSFWESLLKYH
jgi:hypothetical protein